MKKQLLFSFIGFVALQAANIPVQSVSTVTQKEDKELAWVDEQIQAILPSRIGVADGLINTLKDPMKMKKPVPVAGNGSRLLAPPKLGGGIASLPKIVEEPLKLQALFNKSALINKKWYKVNDSVRTFTLVEIKNNSVLLRGKTDQQLILFLTKSNSNIQLTTK